MHGRSSLPPLRASGVHVLNYLDDWLILAQSRDMPASHVDELLHHLEFLRLCVNMSKSILALSQSIMYLGVCFDKKRWRCALNSQERLAAILSSMRNFRPGSLLHMHLLQFWLKSRVPWMVWISGHLRMRPWRKDDVTCCGHDRRIDMSPGKSVRGHTGFLAMVSWNSGMYWFAPTTCLWFIT